MEFTPESTLLSAIMKLDTETGIDEAGAVLRPEMFRMDEERDLYRAMLTARQETQPVDILCLHDILQKQGMDGYRAAQLLARIECDPSPMEGRVRIYAQKVREAWVNSKSVKLLEQANKEVAAGGNRSQIIQDMQAELAELSDEKLEDVDHLIGDVAPIVLSAIADRMAGDDSNVGLRTGIQTLDALTTGINREELWVVGGMPGRGKTALALQAALNLAGSGFPVYFVSLEMSKDAIFRRFLKMKFGASVTENPSSKRWSEMLEYGADLKTLPLYVNDSSSLDITEICSRARIRIRQSKIRLVVVDYIQLIRAQGRDRRESVGEATNALRALAKDTGVPVLALSQLRRPGNLNDRPSMIDLKESGDIEAHSHVVLLLYMPLSDDGRFTGEEEIIIGKQREGPTGTVPVYFHGQYATFREREKR